MHSFVWRFWGRRNVIQNSNDFFRDVLVIIVCCQGFSPGCFHREAAHAHTLPTFSESWNCLPSALKRSREQGTAIESVSVEDRGAAPSPSGSGRSPRGLLHHQALLLLVLRTRWASWYSQVVVFMATSSTSLSDNRALLKNDHSRNCYFFSTLEWIAGPRRSLWRDDTFEESCVKRVSSANPLLSDFSSQVMLSFSACASTFHPLPIVLSCLETHETTHRSPLGLQMSTNPPNNVLSCSGALRRPKKKDYHSETVTQAIPRKLFCAMIPRLSRSQKCFFRNILT